MPSLDVPCQTEKKEEPERCQWCNSVLPVNENGYMGARWYKVRSGWTHQGSCYTNQVQKELSAPIFPAVGSFHGMHLRQKVPR